MISEFADAAGVPASGVALVVASASVELKFIFVSADEHTTATVISNLKRLLADDTIAAQTLGVSVTGIGTVTEAHGITTDAAANGLSPVSIGSPSPPPSPSSPTSSSNTVGVIVAASVGGVIFIVLAVMIICWFRSRKPERPATDAKSEALLPADQMRVNRVEQAASI